jgi:hypothetical protein
LRTMRNEEDIKADIAALRASRGQAATRLESATAEVDAAQHRLEEVRNTNALMRAMRRLPSVEQQTGVVQQARTRQQDLINQVDALAARLREAEEQASQIRALRQKIVDTTTQAKQLRLRLDSLQAEVNLARRRADSFAGTVVSKISERKGVEARLDAFLKQYTIEPSRLLAHARDATAGLDHLERRLRDQRGALEQLEKELALRLKSALRNGERLGLVNGSPEGLDEGVRALRSALERATGELGGRTSLGLSEEIEAHAARLSEIADEVQTIEAHLAKVEELVISEAQVLATTLTRAYLRDSIQSRRFDTVILDEASMAPIPALWIAARLASRSVVAVGDFLQLPPIVVAKDELAKQWLGRDVFEAAGVKEAWQSQEPPDHFVGLREQWRMHPRISRIVNELVYERELIDHEHTRNDRFKGEWYDKEWGHDSPVLMVDTESAHAWVTSVGRSGSTSRLNFLSATICADLAERLLRPDRPLLLEGDEPRILIVCPYRPHAKLLQLLIREQRLDAEVTAGTAHSFQGAEADVVILDLVNDEPHWRVGMFIPANDEVTKRLLNVAISRARNRLIVVGDFRYIQAQGRRAWLGAKLIPKLKAVASVVDAVDIVPTDASARAAALARSMRGGRVEAKEQRITVTQENFFPLLEEDLANARSRVVVYSPFITAARLEQIGIHLRAAAEKGVRVFVVTKPPVERAEKQRDEYRRLETTLRDWGVTVIPKAGMHEKLVFIDDGVLWSGSLNPLSFSSTQEIMERRESRAVAEEYSETLRMEEMLGLFDSHKPRCPVCDGTVGAKEGANDPYYWTCLDQGCYSWNIGQEPPTEGLLVCPKCSSHVTFGKWGEDAAWRCQENFRHYFKVKGSHLRLPRMVELIPKRQRAALARKLGVELNR